MSSSALGTKPKTITGGCLCAALRYTITFPDSHDFVSSAVTCQLVFRRDPDAPRIQHHARGDAGFCTQCSSWLYYRSEGQDSASICIGTVDQEVLIGKKGERDGFGRALANGLGGHEWCENEIPGVTDDVPLLRRGERNQGSQEESAAVKSKL
ncbi:glutathione-dependent formaldehyde-activating enzyme [Colletotrichum tofieldiae]|nr:glutathione-dependent formaldehyde-activating enzyme [Colletotrichum tofieldiae]